jgi:nicotinamide-nucleotide adenylyltransferase
MNNTALYLGRFQPFHLGHLDAIEQIIADGVSNIIIGIGSSQEESTRSNPFSYNERSVMINRVLSEKQIDFEIYPIPDFPNNQDWVDYIEDQLPHFNYIYSGNPYVQICFEEGKVAAEFRTLDIVNTVKGITIRNHIEKREDGWIKLLPISVVEFLNEINGVNKLQNIFDQNNLLKKITNSPINKILVIEKVTRFEYLQRKNELEYLDKDKYQQIYTFDQEHTATRKEVLQKLADSSISFEIIKEKNIDNVDLDSFELIITLGGDGTFLNIAKKIRNQIIMGINSEPGQSVGYITRFDLANLSSTLENLKLGLYDVELWDRLSVSINGVRLPFLALNEVLVAKLNIYQTSKLEINLDNLQKGYCLGNGVIVSTKMGSTAFYKSAGGASFDSPNFAYTMILPFQINGNIEQNRILSPNSELKIIPKRDDHYVIFDCDETRKILLNDEDEVEIQKLDSDILKVLI